MKYYNYFPGCSSSHGGSKAYGNTAEAIVKMLDAELIELKDWNCCGSSPYSSQNELASIALAARNLSLAEKKGFDLVTPCSACYVILKQAHQHIQESKETKARIDEALKAAKLEYNGTTKVRHLLDIIVNDIGYDAIKGKVTKPLNGLKVAAYYGCQIVRPKLGFDHTEIPDSLDKLISALGGEPVNFPLKTQCCGGSLIISEEKVATGLIRKILDSAQSNGAECLVTVCPLCQTNLDAYQGQVNRRYKTNFNLPVLFFTQLMGLAFGMEEKDLGLKTNIVPVDKVVAKNG